MNDGDKPEGRGYVDQDGERPKLIRRMDDQLVATGMSREDAEREVDRIGTEVLNRSFNSATTRQREEVQGTLNQLHDNARLVSHSRIRLRPSGIGGLLDEGAALRSARHPGPEPTPFENLYGVDSGAMSESSLEQMEIEIQEKRVSKVFPLFDWPRGTRRRKWGILHDQIWFYAHPSKAILLTIAAMGIYYENTADRPVQIGEQWWRWDPERDAWLRLYMDRKMLWLGRLKFRIHRFYSGDDDSAPHDHPWAFVTFPLSDYCETVSLRYKDEKRGFTEYRTVRCVSRWRFHYRPALFRHFVLEPDAPFTTLVVTWGRERRWGFWPKPDSFVPYDEWTNYV